MHTINSLGGREGGGKEGEEGGLVTYLGIIIANLD